MYTIRHGTRIRIDTPAKLNLFLELHGRRGDGYHELKTLMVPISVYDSLVVQSRADGRLNLNCYWAAGRTPTSKLPDPHSNLAYKALDLLRQSAGIAAGADLWLCKRIPSEAGLGGASSDAAAALLAANAIWNLDWSRQQLAEVAADLGSDVPFFLFDSPALCSGRGEVVEPLPFRCRLHVVLINPPVGLSTAKVYQHAEVPDRPTTCDGLRAALEHANPMNIGKLLFNRLQAAAASISPWIERIASAVDVCDPCGHQMSGSGQDVDGSLGRN